MSISDLEYAVISGASYISSRSRVNTISPGEFEIVGQMIDDSSGFEGYAFRKGSDIVIGYAGTYDKDILGDIISDLALGSGFDSEQLFLAAKLYIETKRLYPNDNITFSGHSLGGGLASIMAVFFELPAVVFDQAPFRASVSISTAEEIYSRLQNSGIDPGDSMNSFFDKMRGDIGFLSSNYQIKSIAILGEFLTGNAPDAARVGQTTTYLDQSTNLGGITLHSQALLILMMHSDDISRFAKDHPMVIEKMMDENLFSFSTDGQRANFLEHLINNDRIGSKSIGGNLLDMFVSEVDLVINTLYQLGSNEIEISKLIDIAIQNYYNKTGYAEDFLFKSIDGNIYFDVSELMSLSANGNENNPALDVINSFKGDENISNFGLSSIYSMDNSSDVIRLSSLEDRGSIIQALYELSPFAIISKDSSLEVDYEYSNEWVKDRAKLLSGLIKSNLESNGISYSSDNTGMVKQFTYYSGGENKALILNDISALNPLIGTVSFGSNSSDTITTGSGDDSIYGMGGADTLEGGYGNDYLEGGSGKDTLFGGADDDRLIGMSGTDILRGDDGNDTLDGGTGNDLLDGGANTNTYLLKTGDGSDIIQSSSGLDRLEIDADPETLKIRRGSDDSSRDLIITYGENDTVTIEGFYDSPDKQLESLKIGNRVYRKQELVKAGLDYHGTSGSEKLVGLYDYSNTITSHGGSDTIIGGRLNDIVQAQGDSDYDNISTGSGDDQIYSGGGNDILNGGDGNDTYYISGGRDTIFDSNKLASLDGDSIVLTQQTIKSDIDAKRSGNDLVIYYDKANLNNQITVANWYSGSGNKIEALRFNTGINANSMTWQELEALAAEKDPGEELTEQAGEVSAPAQVNNVPRTYDPLVLDLDGDGIHTFGLNQGIHFDHDNDGIREQSGWVHGSDGFLVLDRNGNSKIDDGSELFGNNSYIAFDAEGNGTQKAAHGYAALAYHDSNQDGVINADDAVFGSLKVWTDLNGDGLSQDYELSSLADLNIKSINLTSTRPNTNLGNGNSVAYQSNYTKDDGTVLLTQSLDLIFDTNVVKSDVEIAADLVGLPNIAGTGFATTLLQAATTHEPLADILKAMVAAPTRLERVALIDSLIVEWAKSATTFSDFYERTQAFKVANPSSTVSIQFGYANDQVLTSWDKLAIAEVFAGNVLRNADQTTFTANIDFTGINAFYDSLKSFILTSIEDQSALQGYKQAVFPENDFETINAQALQDTFQASLHTNQSKAISDYMSFTGYYYDQLMAAGFDPKAYVVDVIGGLSLDAQSKAVLASFGVKFDGVTGPVVVVHGQSAHYLAGVLLGDVNGNTLTGGSGQDVIFGGAGNDILNGGYMGDTMNGGEGDDIIGSDSLNINGVSGSSPQNYTGMNMVNTLIGGRGNDQLYGSTFGDIYKFSLGDGHDTIIETAYVDLQQTNKIDRIVFDETITQEMITYRRFGDDVIIDINNGADSITIKKWFSSNLTQTGKIDFVEFANGVIIDSATIEAAVLNVIGTDGNDVLTGHQYRTNIMSGGAGDDILTGGLNYSNTLSGDHGNDTLTGGNLQDVLLGGAGNDTLNGGYLGDTMDGGEGDDILGKDALNIAGSYTGTYTYITEYTNMNQVNTLIGGKGNDQLYGSSFGDIYKFSLGDGHDTITETTYVNLSQANKVDRIVFDSTITQDMIEVRLSGSDVIILINNGADSLTIKNWFGGAIVDFIDFSDGSQWTSAQLESMALNQVGTIENDVIAGHLSRSNVISGLEGDDTLTGGNLQDVLLGGAGNDTLSGGYLGDTMDGGEGDDILGKDPLNIAGSYTGTYTYITEYTDMNQVNTLIGGKGNDQLYGSSFGDIYKFSLGDGHDTIIETTYRNTTQANKVDRLVFDATITQDMVYAFRSGNDMMLSIWDGADSIRVKDWYSGKTIDQVEFQDGTLLTAAYLEAQAATNTAPQQYAQFMIGTGTDDNYSVAIASENVMIKEFDDQAISHDTLWINESAHTDIWFEIKNDDLVMTRLSGSLGSITLDGWANGDTPAMEVIQANGFTIDSVGIDLLLQAMAGFTTPHGDMSSVTPEGKTAIEDAMAMAWRTGPDT